MRMIKTLFLPLVLLAATSAWAGGERSPAADGAAVYIIEPVDGAVVKSPVKVVFGLTGMGVAPAGVGQKHTGHHHLLINVDELPSMNKPIPADKNHVHFGGGQTEVEIELKPGKHTLQLLLGDQFHIPHRPPVMSDKISITVAADKASLKDKLKADAETDARLRLQLGR